MRRSSASPDVLIVGAGIVGAACALELARAGLRVRVVDAAFPAGETTAAGMGHLVVLDDSEAQFALSRLGVELWRELLPELGAEVCEDDPCGTLWIAADDEEMAHVRDKAASYGAHGVEVEILDAVALAEAEPALRRDLVGALRVPGDRVIYAPSAARRLLELAKGLGAVVEIGRRIVRLEAGAAWSAEGERIEVERIVNAAGCAASELLPGLEIEPRKGHLVITERTTGLLRRAACRHQLVELGYLKSAHTMTAESVAFNVQPRSTGQLLIGSSRELVGWDRSINRRIVARMLERAFHYMPGLADLQALRTWVGFRPTTPDKLPRIGRWPGLEGVYVAAGHEGLGITTATSTARLLADLILRRPPSIDPAPFAPGRAAAGRLIPRA